MLSLRASNEGFLGGKRCALAHRGWVGENIRLCEQTSLLLSLPTVAENTIVGRQAETEVALTGEGGTQLAAARDRCSS